MKLFRKRKPVEAPVTEASPLRKFSMILRVHLKDSFGTQSIKITVEDQDQQIGPRVSRLSDADFLTYARGKALNIGRHGVFDHNTYYPPHKIEKITLGSINTSVVSTQ